MSVSDQLSGLMPIYGREARKCLKGKAYLAAIVMEVAALEAGLQAMCFIYPNEVKKTSIYLNKRFRRKRNKALDFTLAQLIKIAEERKWFPTKRIIWGGKRATVGGFTHEIRKIRNYVHPGVRALDQTNPLKFNKAVYDVVYEVVDVANSWLLHHVEKGLLRAMAREERHSKKTKSASP